MTRPMVWLIPACAALLVGCATTGPAVPASSAPVLPKRLLPASPGGLVFHREPAAEQQAFTKPGSSVLVSAGEVYSIHAGPQVLGSFQIEQFKPQYSSNNRHVSSGILTQIGGATATPVRLGQLVVSMLTVPGLTVYVYFPPSGRYFELLTATTAFSQADQVFADILAYQTGGQLAAPAVANFQPLDPRRGGEY